MVILHWLSGNDDLLSLRPSAVSCLMKFQRRSTFFSEKSHWTVSWTSHFVVLPTMSKTVNYCEWSDYLFNLVFEDSWPNVKVWLAKSSQVWFPTAFECTWFFHVSYVETHVTVLSVYDWVNDEYESWKTHTSVISGFLFAFSSWSRSGAFLHSYSSVNVTNREETGMILSIWKIESRL